jgi:hypothetical protein
MVTLTVPRARIYLSKIDGFIEWTVNSTLLGLDQEKDLKITADMGNLITDTIKHIASDPELVKFTGNYPYYI